MKKNTEIKPVLQEVDYGEINVKLDNLLKEKNITTYKISTRIKYQISNNSSPKRKYLF